MGIILTISTVSDIIWYILINYIQRRVYMLLLFMLPGVVIDYLFYIIETTFPVESAMFEQLLEALAVMG